MSEEKGENKRTVKKSKKAKKTVNIKTSTEDRDIPSKNNKTSEEIPVKLLLWKVN